MKRSRAIENKRWSERQREREMQRSPKNASSSALHQKAGETDSMSTDSPWKSIAWSWLSGEIKLFSFPKTHLKWSLWSTSLPKTFPSKPKQINSYWCRYGACGNVYWKLKLSNVKLSHIKYITRPYIHYNLSLMVSCNVMCCKDR